MGPVGAAWELVRAPLTLLEAARGLARLRSLDRLASLDDSLRRLSQADGPLDRLTDVSETLRRLAGLDESLRKLGALEESLDRIAAVGESLDRMADLPETIRELHVTVQQLGLALRPIGRIAGRIPGSGSRADRRVRAQQP